MKCYLCKSNNISLIRKKIRYSIKKNVLKCSDCGLVFIQPGKKELSNFYNTRYRKHYSPIINKHCSPVELFNFYLPLQYERIKKFRHLFNSKSRVLEIGCSAGYFLYRLKKYVKECVGIELNSSEADFARKKCKVKIFSQPLEKTDLPLGYFDAVFMFDTLEHIVDPLHLLRVIGKYMKPKGRIRIQVPNINNPLLSVYKLKCFEDFYYNEAHLFYFSSRTLGRLMTNAGYRGKIHMLQQYSLLNHMHWKASNSPMPSLKEGISVPRLIINPVAPKKIIHKFNSWFFKIDCQYRDLLCRNNIADTIIFIGRKIDEHKKK